MPLALLRYAPDRLGPGGRILRGSLPSSGWFFCFHDKGKLLSLYPFLHDHPSVLNSKTALGQKPWLFLTLPSAEPAVNGIGPGKLGAGKSLGIVFTG